MEQMGVADLERRLGSDRLDVRLRAIDALERIMIDSARDHPAIVELLAAFIRECTPAAAGPDLDTGGQPEPRPPADSQAALTVLARRPAGRTERGPVNLACARLAGANLSRANLTHADLGCANLTRATLVHSNLTLVNLILADLTGADLAGADLTEASL